MHVLYKCECLLKNSQANIKTQITEKLNSTRYKITVAIINLNIVMKTHHAINL